MPPSNSCQRHHRRRCCLCQRRNLRSNRSTLPGVCWHQRRRRRLRRRRRCGGKTLSTHISQHHQGESGVWSLCSCSSTLCSAGSVLSLELARPVDKNARSSDNTIKHTSGFITHPQVNDCYAASMPAIISIVQGHHPEFHKVFSAALPLSDSALKRRGNRCFYS